MGTGYTGHGPSGGVQQHSKGPLYPFTVIAIGDPNRKLMWAAMDLRSGSVGTPRHTYNQAEIDVHGRRVLGMMHS